MAKQIKHTDRPYPFNLLEAMHEQNPMIPVDLEYLPSDFKGSINYILTEKLTDRERDIFKFRFQHNMPLAQIAQSLGLSTERIRQCEERALRKLACTIYANYIIHGVAKLTAGDLDTTFKPEDLFEEHVRSTLLEKESFIRKVCAQYKNVEDVPIENLGFSLYIVNTLARAGLTTAGDIMQKAEIYDFRKIRGIGPASIMYIMKVISILNDISTERGDSSVRNISISQLDLSVRSYNCLARAGVRHIGDIWNWKEEDYLKLKNLGRKSYEEITTALRYYKKQEALSE